MSDQKSLLESLEKALEEAMAIDNMPAIENLEALIANIKRGE